MTLLTIITIVSVALYSISFSALGVMAQLPSNETSQEIESQSLIAQEQNSASTYQPGFWQPVDRVNPDAPIFVNIINQTGVSLEYSLTTYGFKPQSVFDGKTAQLTDLPKDAYILINPMSAQISLKYDINIADGNIVNVTVQPSSDFSGESTINIQPNGAIYKY